MSSCDSDTSSTKSTESTEPVEQQTPVERRDSAEEAPPEEVILVPENEEKDDDEKKKEEPAPSISFFAVYRYADKLDYLLLAVGVVLCIVQGGFTSVNSIIFRHLTDALIEGQEGWVMGTFNYSKFYHDAMRAIMMYVTYGLVVFVTGFASMSCWHVLCERQIHKIRLEFFQSVLHQNIAWFDKNKAGALTSKLSDGIDRIKDGIGDKSGLLITSFVQFVGGMTVSFIFSWKLTLVMLGILPAMLGTIGAIGFFSKKYITQENGATAQAGSVAEEVVNGIRTVISLNGQAKEEIRYNDELVKIQKAGNKKNIVVGGGFALIFFLLFLAMGIAFWYGTKLYVNGEISPGTTFAAFWAFMVAMFSIAQGASQIPAVIGSRTNAAAIFEIIDRVPEINTKSQDGLSPDSVSGKLEIRDVKFRYASRPDVEVLKGVSLNAEPGEVIALVGHSGSGKSTIISLLQRFYDFESGSILIDGNEIKDLNLNWLRSIIGVVSQEPCIFATTIAENVRLGNMNLSEEDLQRVCKISNAHGFIMELPNGYLTRVGDGGIQLSGGQKQRLAIARALAKNPKILLLDEATSALDTQSERIVQRALDQARVGRTTILIAHRLSTVRHCNNIIVFENGLIKEQGTHEELMNKQGIYEKLVKAQEITQLDDNYDPNVERHESFLRNEIKRRSQRLSLALSNASTQPELDAKIGELEDEVEQSKANPASLTTIIKFAKQEWAMLGIAFVGALARGTSFPIFSIIYGNMFKTLAMGTDKQKLDGALHNLLYFSLLGVFSGVSAGLSSYLFSAAGESLTRRLRLALFSNIVSQDGAYFDSLDHSPGKLSARLATDGPNVRAAIDQRLGDVVQSFSAILSGIIIAFSYGPEMAPIGIVTSGFLAFVQTAIAQYLKVRGHKDAKLAEEPSRLASETIDHHRTVQSLGQEQHFTQLFARLNDQPHKRAIIRGVIQSLTYAFQAGYVFFNFAIAYRFGVFLVYKRVTSPYTVFQVIEALNCASMSMLAFAAYFPEYVRARLSATLIFKMLQDEPEVKSPPVSIQHLDANKLRPGPELSDVQFDAVDFAYPINKERKVLKNFNMNVSKGMTIALVGHSGCGKSTVIQLIERFYDPDSGTIKLGHQNLCNLNLGQVRTNISLVSQEPILFNFSIKENITYGVEGEVPMSEVELAAKQANAHDFISRLPSGYDTIVGAKGSQLSGGQKQRIAIARAIIRSPQILLLDEATSALDSQSEKLVQKALDQARVGRTCLVVAHRLSTIQHADLIVVFKDGKIVEKGTHQSLLALNGLYCALTKEQGLN